MQKKIHSIFEAFAHVVLGVLMTVIFLAYVVPLFWPAYSFTLLHASQVTIGLMILSFIRTYIIRRYFNHLTIKIAEKKINDR